MGGIEAFSIARHNFDFYNSVGVTGDFSRPSSTQAQPIESVIFDALRVLVGLYAILSAIPANEHRTVSDFVRLPSIDLRTCTLFVEREKKIISCNSGGSK